LHPILQAGDLLTEVAVTSRQGPQHEEDVRVVDVVELIGAGIGQCRNDFRLG